MSFNISDEVVNNIKKINKSELIIQLDNNKYLINANIDEHNEPVISYSKILEGKIVRASEFKWYLDKIGDIIEVVKLYDSYDAIGYNGVICEDDIEILTEDI